MIIEIFFLLQILLYYILNVKMSIIIYIHSKKYFLGESPTYYIPSFLKLEMN